MYPILSLFIPALVSGWGGDGHSIITEIASRLIDDRTNAFLVNFLGKEYIETSRWADTDEAKTKYPESKYYHYSNTPYRSCQEFDLGRDCGSTEQTRGLCLVSGLVENIRMAADPSVSRETRVDALKFVLHFVGDIHQPLHTGFQKDRGGSTIKLSTPTNTSLHEVWDNNLIERAISGTEHKNWLSLADEIYARISKNDRAFLKRIEASDKVTEWSNNIGEDKRFILGYISRLATETSTASTCKHAYVDEHMRYLVKGDVISESYITTRLPVVIIQLSKASSRLAILLDAIAEDYAARLSEQRYWSRSIRVQEAIERMLQSPNPSESQFHVHTSNSFASLEQSAHMPDMPDEPMIIDASKKTTTAIRGQKSGGSREDKEEEEVDWKSVAEYNEKSKSQTIIDGVDLTKIWGRNVGSIFLVTDKALPRKTVLRHGDSWMRAINYNPDFVYFDKRVFPDPPSPKLAKLAFLRAKGYAADALCETEPFEKLMGYIRGLNFTTSHTVPFVSRHLIQFPEHGKVFYGGDYLGGEVGQQYLQRRLEYTRFAYSTCTDRVLGGQIKNQKTYWGLYRKTIETLGSRFMMVSHAGKIAVITLVDLWKKGDGKNPETIFPGFYYFFSPELYDHHYAWKFLLDGRIFPGPPPDDISFISDIIDYAKPNEIVATGRSLRWFEGMEEYYFGRDKDRMSRFPNFGSVEMFTYKSHDNIKSKAVTVMHVSTQPIASELRQNKQDWFRPPSSMLSDEKNSSGYYQIILPSTNRSDNLSNGGNRSYNGTTHIPFARADGTADVTAINNIALPSLFVKFASPDSELEDEISDHILRPRQSVVMITEPESGLVVFMQGFDFIPEMKTSSLGESLSFVACLVSGRYAKLLFDSDHSFVLVDERILRTKRKALSLVILRDMRELSAYNEPLARSINGIILSSQFGKDLGWFIETVVYSNNSTTDSNPRWSLNSGLRMPSALGAPPLPIYQYRM